MSSRNKSSLNRTTHPKTELHGGLNTADEILALIGNRS
jgi:hypothetical protein